jgi:hypothetical protein
MCPKMHVPTCTCARRRAHADGGLMERLTDALQQANRAVALDKARERLIMVCAPVRLVYVGGWVRPRWGAVAVGGCRREGLP